MNTEFDISVKYKMSIVGLFEIHIIVSPEDELHLFRFIKSLPPSDKLNCRATKALTFYGKYPNQPMITYWLSSNSADAIKNAFETKEKMEEFGLSVKRVKVEALMNSKGVPETPLSNNYFEFHFKIKVKDVEEWNHLAEICAPHGAHLFFNPYKKDQMVPIVTLREYESKTKALGRLTRLIDDLNKNKMNVCADNVHKEHSVLDTNTQMDEGWLFDYKPESIKTSYVTV